MESRNRRASVALFPLIRIIVTLFSVPRESSLIKSKKIRKPGEGSLHPQPEGRGIRDPLRSRCNKIRRATSDRPYEVESIFIKLREPLIAT
jgi:hypothetical protein